MDRWKKIVSTGLTASLLASMLATTFAGSAFAATTATVPANAVGTGAATAASLGPVSFSAGSTDISTTGTLTATLPAGYAWATSGTVATTETGTGFAVDPGTMGGGSSVSFVVTSAPAVTTGVSLAFSGAMVKGTAGAATGNVTLTYSGTWTGGSLTIATVSTKNGHDAGDNNGGRDHDRGKGHGARKVGFFQNPAWACASGAVPAAGATTYGFAKVNTTGKKKLNVNVVLKGAAHSASYDIFVYQDPGGCSPTKAGTVQTDVNGKGTGHFRLAVVSGARHFSVTAVGGGGVLATRAASLTVKGK